MTDTLKIENLHAGVEGKPILRGVTLTIRRGETHALMGPNGFNQPLVGNAIPGVKGEGFMGGEILLGGRGSDLLEGKAGDDLIDGDVWLHAQLRAVLNDGTVKLVDDPRDLIDDVFSDPQRLNPGSISIVRSIVTPVVPRPDCGAAHPLNCDTAVFANPIAEY